MGKNCFLPLMMLAVLGSARANSEPRAIEVYAEWKLSVDAEGRVTSLNFRPGQVQGGLQDKLESAIRGWSFKPGAINGRPAETSTTLIVNMSALPKPDDQGYEVTITRVRTGGAIAKIREVPSFSQSQVRTAMRGSKNPLVLVRVTYDASGKPENVEIAEDSPVRKGSFAQSAMSAVRTWTFDPERVAGQGLRASVLVPICFKPMTSGDSSPACERDDVPEGASTDLGQSLALDSSITLESDVVGSTL